MAWIETLREDEWTGALAAMYEQVADREHDRVDNILQVQSLNPAAMGAHSSLYTSAMTGTRNLRKVDREMIALVVSDINKCHY